MKKKLNKEAFELLFEEARTPRAWIEEEIPLDLLRDIWNETKFGPTSANCFPLRVAFVASKEAKEKLKPCLDPGNVNQTMSAPITAIFAYDLKFYEYLPKLYPHTNAKSWFEGNDRLIEETAFRNGTLQAGYFMIVARGHGIDCGPMSGFDRQKTNEVFFKNTSYRSNFLCNLGIGDLSEIKTRDWRFPFDDACKIL